MDAEYERQKIELQLQRDRDKIIDKLAIQYGDRWLDRYLPDGDGYIDTPDYDVRLIDMDLCTLGGLKFKRCRNFWIRKNRLTSDIGFPTILTDSNFDVSYNELVILEQDYSGLHEHIWFNCSHNKLKSFRGMPRICEELSCSCNAIENMDYAPEIVSGTLECAYNRLTSLIGMPYVGSCVNLRGNPDLLSLEGLQLHPDLFIDHPLSEHKIKTAYIEFMKKHASKFRQTERHKRRIEV